MARRRRLRLNLKAIGIGALALLLLAGLTYGQKQLAERTSPESLAAEKACSQRDKGNCGGCMNDKYSCAWDKKSGECKKKSDPKTCGGGKKQKEDSTGNNEGNTVIVTPTESAADCAIEEEVIVRKEILCNTKYNCTGHSVYKCVNGKEKFVGCQDVADDCPSRDKKPSGVDKNNEEVSCDFDSNTGECRKGSPMKGWKLSCSEDSVNFIYCCPQGQTIVGGACVTSGESNTLGKGGVVSRIVQPVVEFAEYVFQNFPFLKATEVNQI